MMTKNMLKKNSKETINKNHWVLYEMKMYLYTYAGTSMYVYVWINKIKTFKTNHQKKKTTSFGFYFQFTMTCFAGFVYRTISAKPEKNKMSNPNDFTLIIEKSRKKFLPLVGVKLSKNKRTTIE